MSRSDSFFKQRKKKHFRITLNDVLLVLHETSTTKEAQKTNNEQPEHIWSWQKQHVRYQGDLHTGKIKIPQLGEQIQCFFRKSFDRVGKVSRLKKIGLNLVLPVCRLPWYHQRF